MKTPSILIVIFLTVALTVFGKPPEIPTNALPTVLGKPKAVSKVSITVLPDSQSLVVSQGKESVIVQQSTNLTFSLAFDLSTNNYLDGLVCYVFDASGNVLSRAFTGFSTNTLTVTNWPLTRDFYGGVSTFASNSVPRVTCVTNRGVVTCTTNYIVESAISRVEVMPSNCPPFAFITNGAVYLRWYGFTNKTYGVYAVSNGVTLTNALTLLTTHTNGPMQWLVTPRSKAGQFRVGVK